jgi:F420H(2)-dependent quinone reductase
MTEFRAPEVDDSNGRIIAEFRSNGGKVGGPHPGADILLLHHTGARSGTQRVSPLAFQWLGESFAVFASKAGAPENPAARSRWWCSIRSNNLKS